MLEIAVTLKNFRCFEDQEPAIIHLKPGLTAFVGANNAGKSSLLRMFYELRDLFRRVEDASAVLSWMRGGSVPIGLQEVPDPTALQSDANERSMTVRLEARGINESGSVSAIEVEFPRQTPNVPRAQFFLGGDYIALQPDNGNQVGGYDFSVGNARISTKQFADAVRPLAKTVYIGPFRNALNEGASGYYDLSVGTAFVNLWKNWKNGNDRANNRAIKNVENAIRHLFGFEQLEINPSADNKRLRVFVNGQSFDLQEQGSGLAQFILSFGTAATSKPSLILIDEPELNLHPSLQVDFLTTLGTFATDGVLFSTHSIGLARSIADTIYSLQRKGAHSVVRRYEETPNLVEFAGELSFSAFRELGFERLLLVEGPTDVRTLQQLLRKLDKDHRVVIFPLIGHAFASGDHSEALQELTRITTADRIAAIVDSERSGADQPPERKREAFRRVCERLGFMVHVTDRRAIENYFPSRAIQEAVGPQYEALGPYEKHGASKKNWSKSLNWKIAHATTLDELADTDLIAFLSRI
jgi:ABC-type cobalamin/Fe3+-siderophores transport system ATPase subunit